MTRKRLTTILLVTLLMMSTVSVAFTGTVAAQDYEPGDRISRWERGTVAEDETLYVEKDPKCQRDGFDLDAIIYSSTHDCYVVRDATISDETTANYGVDNINDAAEHNLNEAYNKTLDGDVLNDALEEATEAYADALANDTSKSTAQLKADNAATREVIQRLNNDLLRASNNVVSRTASLDEPNGSSVIVVGADDTTSGLDDVASFNATLFPNSPESTNITYTGLQGGGYTWSPFLGQYSSSRIYSNGATGTDNLPKVTYDSSDYSDKQIQFNKSKFQDSWNSYINARSAAVSEIETFSTSLNESEFNDLDPSDVMDRSQLASEWASKYNETGDVGYAALLAADNGYSIPSNATSEYDIRTPDGNFTGTIFGQPGAWNSTNNSILNGSTYDGANQTAFVLTKGGDKIPLDGSYTVEGIRDADGNTLNETSMRAPSQEYFADASAFRENLEMYQELMNQSEQLPDGDDGGVGFPDLSQGDGTIVMVLMVLGGLVVLFLGVGGVVLLMRSGGSGSTYNDYGGGR